MPALGRTGTGRVLRHEHEGGNNLNNGPSTLLDSNFGRWFRHGKIRNGVITRFMSGVLERIVEHSGVKFMFNLIYFRYL